MEDLARATGLTKSSIYHHVAGKEELLRLAVARAVDALFAVLDEPASTAGPAVARLEHVVRRSVFVLAEQLPYVTLLLRVRGNTGAERWALERRREFDRRLSALVQAAIDEGDLRADLDPRLVTRLLFGAVNSIVEWLRPDRRHPVAGDRGRAGGDDVRRPAVRDADRVQATGATRRVCPAATSSPQPRQTMRGVQHVPAGVLQDAAAGPPPRCGAGRPTACSATITTG